MTQPQADRFPLPERPEIPSWNGRAQQAGWYPVPASPDILRYWNGTQWTERHSRRPASQDWVGRHSPEDPYLSTGFGLAFLFPPAGLIWGLRERQYGGHKVVAAAVAWGALYLVLLLVFLLLLR